MTFEDREDDDYFEVEAAEMSVGNYS